MNPNRRSLVVAVFSLVLSFSVGAGCGTLAIMIENDWGVEDSCGRRLRQMQMDIISAAQEIPGYAESILANGQWSTRMSELDVQWGNYRCPFCDEPYIVEQSILLEVPRPGNEKKLIAWCPHPHRALSILGRRLHSSKRMILFSNGVDRMTEEEFLKLRRQERPQVAP